MNINWMPAFAATVCGSCALFLFWKWSNNQKIQKKILNARKRRDKSLHLAEQAVQQFKIQNPGFESSSIVSLSLSELTRKLQEGSLQPDAVLHAFMEKVVTAAIFYLSITLYEIYEFIASFRVEDSIHHAGMDGLLRNCATGCHADEAFTMDDLVDSISADTSGLRCGRVQLRIVFITPVWTALEVNKNLNCSTEFLMESVAQLKDINTQKKGLLYGVPISIKDNVAYKGHDSSCGVVSKLDQPVVMDSVVVRVLKKQGAIPFIKTNIPQGLLNYDCSNPIYGQTLNPCNLQKTPGGSSGGEGALIGGGGSILGLGTDIGGSIRIPSSFCGICGFKPTSKRLRVTDLGGSHRAVEQEGAGVPSPMPRAAVFSGSDRNDGSAAYRQGDLRITVRASPPSAAPRAPAPSPALQPVVLPSERAGPSTERPAVSFDESPPTRWSHPRDSICVLPNQPIHMCLHVNSSPTGAQGISSCVKGPKSVLSSLGPMARDVESLALCMRALLCQDMFTLDPTVPPISFNQKVYESSEPLRIGYYENDGYLQPSPSMARAFRETKDLLERAGHTLVPFQPLRLYNVFHELALRGILADRGVTLLNHLKAGPIDPCLWDQATLLSTPGFIKKLLSIFLKPFEYIDEVIAEWRRLNVDVLLCPILGPAYHFHYCGRLNSALSYTTLYNLLNFPAGVVTVSTVTEEDEAQLSQYKGAHGDIWDKFFVKAVTGAVGLPVAVQCVSLPWQDEMCLRFMREVEQLTAKNKLNRKHND
ncbi:Fatty-acid amide hydrolase 1 [Anabarilius grahami]|uniref:Fatty-acid amide hydrolase 1 n=1 Tax=Anabarilius grahami TaxID=495550 RepID=A0A3N0Y762_ANAGA|nr:Fatty-acid amide hydrolase 1 [Anabarilius grahami]